MVYDSVTWRGRRALAFKCKGACVQSRLLLNKSDPFRAYAHLASNAVVACGKWIAGWSSGCPHPTRNKSAVRLLPLHLVEHGKRVSWNGVLTTGYYPRNK